MYKEIDLTVRYRSYQSLNHQRAYPALLLDVFAAIKHTQYMFLALLRIDGLTLQCYLARRENEPRLASKRKRSSKKQREVPYPV